MPFDLLTVFGLVRCLTRRPLSTAGAIRRQKPERKRKNDIRMEWGSHTAPLLGTHNAVFRSLTSSALLLLPPCLDRTPVRSAPCLPLTSMPTQDGASPYLGAHGWPMGGGGCSTQMDRGAGAHQHKYHRCLSCRYSSEKGGGCWSQDNGAPVWGFGGVGEGL